MNQLPEHLRQQIRQTDYTQFLPMGRVAKYGNYGIKAARAALDPASIRAGVAAFEREAAQYQLGQKKMIRDAYTRHKAALAEKANREAMIRSWSWFLNRGK